MDTLCKNLYDDLCRYLAAVDRLAVAVSGGVDSALLLFAANQTLRKRIFALTAVSETLPADDLADATALARALDVPHRIVYTDELDLPEFTQNTAERCYICKRYRFGKLMAAAAAEGFPALADGENTDDANDYRPGRRAARELGIISPLRDCGLSKADVRTLAKSLGIAQWDKPSSACLASRISHHLTIDRERLKRIDDAERFLKSLGCVRQCRVRMDLADMARIEVEPDDIPKLCAEDVRNRINPYIKSLGFRYVCLDLNGYRTGNLNPMF